MAMDEQTAKALAAFEKAEQTPAKGAETKDAADDTTEVEADADTGAEEGVEETETEGTEETEQLADDEDDLEIGATKYRVKKPIKEAWNGLHKKVQDSAEATRADRETLAKEKEGVAESLRIAGSYVKQVGKIQAINERLEAYDKLAPADWIAWSEQDDAAAKRGQTEVFALRMERDKIMQEINGLEGAIKKKAADEQTARRANAEKELPLKIKDWSPAKKEALQKIAKDAGFSDAELEGVSYDPRVMQILDEARAWRESQAKARAIVKKPVAEVEEIKPITSRTGKSQPTGGFGDNVPMDQFRKNFLKTRVGHR